MIDYQSYVSTMQANKLASNKKGSHAASPYGTTMYRESPEAGSPDNGEIDDIYEQYKNRKIGPFSFDIDDEIDTEVLTNDEIFKDLKELEGILQKDSDNINISSKMMGGRSKKKRNWYIN